MAAVSAEAALWCAPVAALCCAASYYVRRRRRGGAPDRPLLGLKVVCLSDTHGRHREVRVPPGDVLIHAGGFTMHGREEDAVDFNAWLRALPHPRKIVCEGAHEENAPWRRRAWRVLQDATFLQNAATLFTDQSRSQKEVRSVKIFGAGYRPPVVKGATNPYLDAIPDDRVDILVSHTPAKGRCDGAEGCDAVLDTAQRLRPRLIISGDVRGAGGVRRDGGVVYVNAACCGEGYKVVRHGVVVDI